MCGITGGIGASAPSLNLLESQLNSISHRGPDDQGFFLKANVGLGMCRLAIVEVASGKQPASDEDQLIQIVWNGEIYNFSELREDAKGLGLRFRNSSESEVLLNLYLKYGLDLVHKINGMFAIAIYDSRSHSLHLIRDRLGKKPLWITQLEDGTLFFSSEIRAIRLARPDNTLRTEMISEVIQFGYVNSPNSTFTEIQQVPPGHVVSWQNKKIEMWNYWRPSFHPKCTLSYVEAVDKTKYLITAAVKRRLISERPIGSFLSGGYDSTIVTALMCELLPSEVQTFNIGFDNKQFDESNYAKNIANFLGTNHHFEILKPDPSIIIEEIAKILDQPLADSSIIPTYLLSKFARKNVIVALGGDGGDEVFAGYDRYLAVPILQKLNPILNIAKFGLRLVDKKVLGPNRKINRGSTQLLKKESLAHRFSSIHSLVQHDDLREVLHPDVLSNGAESRFIDSFNFGNLSTLDRMIRSDLTFYLPGDILVKADIASMANSLELRSPMLDDDVVDWGLSLPSNFRVKHFESKHILKDVARSLVPAELIERPKMGFGIPRADWLRVGLREMMFDLLTDSTATQRGWFISKNVRTKIDLHMSGIDQDYWLWPILMLELWARTWID